MNLLYNLIGVNTIDSKRGGNAKVEEEVTYITCPLNEDGIIEEDFAIYTNNIATAATFSWTGNPLPKGDILITGQNLYEYEEENLIGMYDILYYEDEHQASFMLKYGEDFTETLNFSKPITNAVSLGSFIQDVLNTLLETFPNRLTVGSLVSITYNLADAMGGSFSGMWGEGSITAKIISTMLTYNDKKYELLEWPEIEESVVEP